MDEVLSEGFVMKITRRDLYTLRGVEWLNDEVRLHTVCGVTQCRHMCRGLVLCTVWVEERLSKLLCLFVHQLVSHGT